MRHYKLFAAFLVIVVLIASAATPAAAHETQEIEGYEVTFGGADEPLITGERMWLEFEIVNNETGEPVENQAETLTVSIATSGSEKTALEASEKHGEPGVYEAPVILTEPGDYVVHLEGSLEDTEVHTHFETEVQDHTELEYPSDESQTSDNQTDEGGFGTIGVIAVIGVVAVIGAFLLRR